MLVPYYVPYLLTEDDSGAIIGVAFVVFFGVLFRVIMALPSKEDRHSVKQVLHDIWFSTVRPYGWIWLLLGCIIGGFGAFLQYTTYITSSYDVEHPWWHVCLATGLCFVPFIFVQPSTTTTTDPLMLTPPSTPSSSQSELLVRDDDDTRDTSKKRLIHRDASGIGLSKILSS